MGENYGDHLAPRMNWRVKNKFTLNEQSRGLSLVKEVVKYYTTRRGILTWTAGVVYGFVRTRPGLEGPDMQFHMAHASYGTAATRLLESEPRHDCGHRPVPAGVARLDPHHVGDARRIAGYPAKLPIEPDRR